MMDQEHLEKAIGAARNRLGISIGPDDPIFSLIVLNEEVMKSLIDSSIKPFAQESEKRASAIIKEADNACRAAAELQKVLPEQAEEAAEKLIRVIGYIKKAGDEFKRDIEEYSSSEFENLKLRFNSNVANNQKIMAEDILNKQLAIEECYASAKLKIQSDANEKTKLLVSDAAKAIKNHFQQEFVSPTNELITKTRRFMYIYAGVLCILSAAIGAIVGKAL